MLIDKLTTRVQGWGSRHLSYAGRVQLVNSVLLHIHSYWSSVFILRRSVLKGIAAICRNSLWDGKTVTNRAPLLSWDLVSRLKRKSGLGIIDCVIWNEAAVVNMFEYSTKD